MTPEELASITGYSRQTINKWVRKEQWLTTPRPGVQGGKARLIHVDRRVRDFIQSAQRLYEPAASYNVSETPLEQLLVTSLKEASEAEQRQLNSLLLREGIAGVLRRLGIHQSEQ